MSRNRSEHDGRDARETPTGWWERPVDVPGFVKEGAMKRRAASRGPPQGGGNQCDPDPRTENSKWENDHVDHYLVQEYRQLESADREREAAAAGDAAAGGDRAGLRGAGARGRGAPKHPGRLPQQAEGDDPAQQGHLAARAQLPQSRGPGRAERLRRRQPHPVGAQCQAAFAEELPPPDARGKGRRSEGGARGRGGGARSREGEEGVISPISKSLSFPGGGLSRPRGFSCRDTTYGSSSRSASAARGESSRRRSLPPKERSDVVLGQREVRRRHDQIDLFRAHHPALLQLGERRPALLVDSGRHTSSPSGGAGQGAGFTAF